jgi:DNA-binding transcriptional ArsR family regulator
MPSTPTAAQPLAPVSDAEGRRLSGIDAVKALAHPVRLGLIEVLGLQGPLTATEAGELLGQSPAACSFHLRQLQRHGVVGEESRGPGRRRYWKLVEPLVSWGATDESDDEARGAVILGDALNTRAFERHRRWLAATARYPRRWLKAAFFREALVAMTADELADVQAQLDAVLAPYLQRPAEDVPEGARLVAVVRLGHPMPGDTSGLPVSAATTEASR